MSKEVKRFNIDVDKFGSPRTYESEHGRWMKRADYDALLAERDSLKRELADLLRVVGMSVDGSAARNKAMLKAHAALQGEQK